MACDRTLLERLADPDPQDQRTVREDPRRLVDSVMRNLQKLLNTRQGEALIQPDYGLPDITECAEGAPETLDRVCRSIKSTIEKFEPRLQRIRVSHVSAAADLNLHFAITGQIVTERGQLPVYFNTTVKPSGNAVLAIGQEVDQSEASAAVNSGVRGSVSRWR